MIENTRFISRIMLEINLVLVATIILSRNGPTGPLGENFKIWPRMKFVLPIFYFFDKIKKMEEYVDVLQKSTNITAVNFVKLF